MQDEDPLLTCLGRRGRPAVVRVLRSGIGEPWTVRGLAMAAGVPHAVAGRAVRELVSLGAVDMVRPGRDARITWQADSPVARFLDDLATPDVRRDAADAFAKAYQAPPGVMAMHAWVAPGDDLADPDAPTRIALVWRRGEEAALDAAGPALDAVRANGLPVPSVTTFAVSALQQDVEEGDETAIAVYHGRVLPMANAVS